jgi:hypothetical protein
MAVISQAACGSDSQGSPGAAGATTGGSAGAGGSASGGAGATDGSAADAPGPGPSTDGWKSAYVDGGVRIGCGDSREAVAGSGAPGLVFGNTAIYVGYEQSGQNQNPVFVRFDQDTQAYCEHHESQGPDGRAVGITWDGGAHAYVVYTVVGGGTSLEGKGGWVPSYAPGSMSGGGPKVSYVGRVETTHGTLQTGTFVIAVNSDNHVNSHAPRGAVTVLADGNVEFLGSSAHKPIDEGWKPMSCTDYPFDSRYRFSPYLATLVCADCTNCRSQKPCP